MRFSRLNFTQRILLAMVAAVVVGLAMQYVGEGGLVTKWLAPVGRIFLNLIKFIVCPLVLFSVMGGVVSMDDVKKVGMTGAKTLAVFFVTSAVAVGFAVAVSLAAKGFFPVLETAGTAGASSSVAPPHVSVADMLIGIFPDNFARPFIDANMLQVIVMAVILALAVIQLGGERRRTLVEFVKHADAMFVKALELIMTLSPLGVFCLMCPVVAENGAAVVGSLAKVVAVAFCCYAAHLAVIDSFVVWLTTGIGPRRFLREMTPAIVFAFTSSSSVGTLPVNMRCARALGVPETVAAFVLPLGATVNMNGTVIYHGVCSVFIAACYGIDLTMGQIAAIIVTSTFASIGTAGVPGAGVVMLAMVLSSAGLPLDGIALVAGVDRIFDMGRTVVNISGDTVAALAVVGRRSVAATF